MNELIGIVTPDNTYNLSGQVSGESTLSGIVTGGAQYEAYAGSYSVTPSGSVQTLETDGKLMTDDITVKGDADLVAGNIKKDVEIFGVTGSYEGGGGSTLIIEVSGTDYEVTGLEAATVSGVSGVYVYYDDGNNGSIFIPDGVGMNNVKQAIEAEIPTKTSDLTNDSGFLTSAVTSFNGQSGAVTYAAPVSSVNGQTGAVTISNATTSAAGLMSADDKTHLESVYADYSSAITALGA